MAQSWDCHGCGDCCRTYAVRVTAEEQARIEAQDWGDEIPTRIVYEKRIKEHTLAHREDGACVFLGPDNRCRMHAKFGAASKPAACRIYPFTFTPAGDHWRVGVRFACPSTVANLGTPLADHASELRVYAGLIEAENPRVMDLPTPLLVKNQSLAWDDLLRFSTKLASLLSEPRPMEVKLREALALGALCRRSSFESVQDERLSEFLDIVTTAMIDDVPADPRKVPAPGWAGRMIFRQVAALYSRKDQGPGRGILSDRGWLGRLAAGAQFALGRGGVPRLHGAIPSAATFADAEVPAALSPKSEALLTRFYRIKVESLAFFGPPNFGLSFWDGFDTLALTYPAMIWLARLINVETKSLDDALAIAIRTIDDNFGFNPLLGSTKQLWALKMLSARGDLPKLIAWYGRRE